MQGKAFCTPYSCLAVLGRGYTLVQKTSGTVILDSEQLSENETLEITFAKGAAEAQVLKIKI